MKQAIVVGIGFFVIGWNSSNLLGSVVGVILVTIGYTCLKGGE